ncbi:MAG TPA: 5-formyltetrahydrofolate cyclo-ligase [Steroidobacteraceae bacterium]|nr:5-formyltetrahydrofolate cyclo-ligase [Steroidobacteraceae bacterium]
MALPTEIAVRRKADRAALIARRLAASSADHAAWSARIEANLRRAFRPLEGLAVGFCWPYQGEFDARPFVRDLRRHGARAALPVVLGKGLPLEFREWWPGVAMLNGVYDLPVPDGTQSVRPQALLIPAVGIGPQGDRLGYGGGYFDRTLAALHPKPIAVGIAFELSRMADSEPHDHDVLMDFVVTEDRIEVAVDGGLEAVDAQACERRLAALIDTRALRPRGLASRA